MLLLACPWTVTVYALTAAAVLDHTRVSHKRQTDSRLPSGASPLRHARLLLSPSPFARSTNPPPPPHHSFSPRISFDGTGSDGGGRLFRMNFKTYTETSDERYFFVFLKSHVDDNFFRTTSNEIGLARCTWATLSKRSFDTDKKYFISFSTVYTILIAPGKRYVCRDRLRPK